MNVIPRNATYGEKYDPAMEVATQEEAQAYFELCVQHTMSFGKTRDEAERCERLNIGYWSGYYSRDTMAKIRELYGFCHPFIGPDDTPEQILEKGKVLGRRAGYGLGKVEEES